jgi:NADPH2:quinone reductase
MTVVPDNQAVALPDAVSGELGASLGIPGITAHRCVFSDGPVTGKRVLVHGVLGAVSSMAAQLARWKGATVVGTVRRTEDVEQVDHTVCESVVALDGPNPVQAVRDIAPDGVDRVIEVSLSDNIDFYIASWQTMPWSRRTPAVPTAPKCRSGPCYSPIRRCA